MTTLVFIRHANSQPSADVPSEAWPLSAKGEARCTLISQQLADLKIDVIYSSNLIRAVNTAQLVAGALDIPFAGSHAAFNEHDRSSNAPFHEDINDFFAAIEGLFAQPSVLSYGAETADAMAARFKEGVQRVVGIHVGQTVAITTHGTVLASYLAAMKGSDPVVEWRAIQQAGQPCYVVIDLEKNAVSDVHGV